MEQAWYNWVLQFLIWFGLFVYLGKLDIIVVPSNTANPSSNNINDDLISVTTTITTASTINSIPDCFNEKNGVSVYVSNCKLEAQRY
jgi:hypothetical protein